MSLLGADDEVLGAPTLAAPGGQADPAALRSAVAAMPRPDAVGHRIVHGGTVFSGPVVLDGAIRRQLVELTDLAPLHQPKSLAALDAVSGVLPDVPAVACFDTAFHAGMPAAASTYAVPAQWRERYGVRRFGFHGLSHAYATRRAAVLLGGLPRRLVVCHLGAGASLCAVLDGRSVDTTMGFTPLEGLVMATRSGSVDPGLVLWMQQHVGLSAAEVNHALEHDSGVLALAGTADMAAVVAADSVALEVYLHRLRGAGRGDGRRAGRAGRAGVHRRGG